MKRLFVDLEVCSACKECIASCSYFYHPHNKGAVSVMELATFALICRKCEEAPCVHSCYHEALEKQPDGILKRYSMRCTSCKACTIACPFGTILPEFIPYLHSRCDFCLEALREGRVPVCVDSCTHKAVEVREVEEDPKAHIYFVGPHLAVHSRRWQREEGALQKK